MDDCLFRNREQGNEWVLFVDIDELATLPGVAEGGLKGLAAALEAKGYEAGNFHSVGYLPDYCDAWDGGDSSGGGGGESGDGGEGGPPGWLGPGLARRMVVRAIYPEGCQDVWQRNCSFDNVFAMGGRRKARSACSSPGAADDSPRPNIPPHKHSPRCRSY